MKKVILFFSFGFSAFLLQAQSSAPDVLASGGGFAVGSGFTNSFTVGQGSLPETFTSGSFMLTQGFQQPADVSTALAPINLSSTINAYPNPTNGIFFFAYTLTENSNVTIEAFDVLGQKVFSEINSISIGEQTSMVNLAALSSGIYFVRCTIKNTSGTTVNTSKVTLTR